MNNPTKQKKTAHDYIKIATLSGLENMNESYGCQAVCSTNGCFYSPVSDDYMFSSISTSAHAFVWQQAILQHIPCPNVRCASALHSTF